MLVCDAVGTVHRAVMAVTLLGLSIMSQRDTTHYVPGAEEKKGRYRRVPLVTAGSPHFDTRAYTEVPASRWLLLLSTFLIQHLPGCPHPTWVAHCRIPLCSSPR
jgi:hypothetical protein